MELEFYKYQGTGNDFVIIDDRMQTFDHKDDKLVRFLCDRKFGIGADGLMLLRNDPKYDFRMVYFNADGHEGSMCGNGGRSLVQFAYDLGIIHDITTFIAVDGPHKAEVKNGVVHLHMIDVEKVENPLSGFFMNTGSPHYVEFVDAVAETPVFEKGKSIRYSDTFAPGGTNVNFVEKLSENHIKVRTYERGVEDETLSCGTGVTACALASHLHLGLQSPIQVDVEGGALAISFTKEGDIFKDVYLIGPAKFVFKGTIKV